MSCTKNSYLHSKVRQINATKKPAKYYAIVCPDFRFKSEAKNATKKPANIKFF